MLQRVLNLGVIICLLSLSTFTATAAVPQSQDGNSIIEHTVEQGQLLNRIAAQYNTSVNKILEINPGLEADKIQIGQKIKVQPNTNTKTIQPIGVATEEKPAEKPVEQQPAEKPAEVEKPVEQPAVVEQPAEKPAEAEKPVEQPAEKSEKPAEVEKPAVVETPAKPVSGNIVEHVVVQGEYLGRIAAKYKTTTAKILELNPGLEADKLSIGQKIKVASNVTPEVETPATEVAETPQTAPKPAEEAKPVEEAKPAEETKPAEEAKPEVATVECIEHTVGEGETFSQIVVKYHTTTVKILKQNPGLEPAKIRPGQKIKIPTTIYKKLGATASENPNGTYHTIVSGDVLGKIAEAYGTTVAKIKELNEGLDPDKIRIGQRIRVK